jgi:hypothetical protein
MAIGSGITGTSAATAILALDLNQRRTLQRLLVMVYTLPGIVDATRVDPAVWACLTESQQKALASPTTLTGA